VPVPSAIASAQPVDEQNTVTVPRGVTVPIFVTRDVRVGAQGTSGEEHKVKFAVDQPVIVDGYVIAKPGDLAEGHYDTQTNQTKRQFETETSQELELDIDGTIDATAKNAGELEIVLRPPRKSNVRVLLLMDVGGSMDPHSELVGQLFSAAKRASNFRELVTHYFHNCVYGKVYDTESFRSTVQVRDLLHHCTREWKLVVVGDAAMHPSELLGGGNWYGTRGAEGESMAGIRWMQLLADHFDRN